jgi:hypothetical protein
MQAASFADAAVGGWQRKWPHYCRICGGWGGHTFYESHGLPGPAERLFDPCETVPSVETCHRCWCEGLDEEGNGPCKFCGWNYDDGLPEQV